MKRIDDLIEAVTYRFRPDVELQDEIARELRAHLEDAVEAARAAGMDEAQAEEAALRAFGDPKEVGEKLWQANYRRMRLRAVAKWAGRLVLMPAGILLAVWLCSATVEVLGANIIKGALGQPPNAVVWEWLPSDLKQWIERRYGGPLPPRKNLNEEQRLALHANASVEKWERLVRRYPDNPVYRARQYVMFLNYEVKQPLLPGKRRIFDRGVALLDAGEKADRENAFWNYMKADLLMHLSGAAKQEEDLSFTFPSAPSRTGSTRGHGERLVFADRPMFERGLDEYRKGLTKPFYKSYAVEFTEQSLALRQSPRTLLDELRLAAESAGTLFADLAQMRNLSRGIMAYAALLVKEGRPQEAEELIRTAPVAGAQLGADARSLIELLVANGTRRIALRQGAALYEKMGKRDEAAEALALARKESQQEGIFLQREGPGGEYRKFLQ